MNTEQELRPCPFCGRSLVLLGRLIQKWEHPAETDADAACPGFRLWFNATPENVAAWNRRSSDEQAPDATQSEAVPVQQSGQRTVDDGGHAVDRTLPVGVASPPAVAAGGVTEERIKRAVDAALGDPENARRAADPDHPEADYAAGRVDAAQCVKEALTAALAVGDEGIREGWQDIATAPKDRPILLGRGKAVFTGWWDKDASGWVDGSTDRYEDLCTYDATHWQPLPNGPGALPTPPSRGEGV